MNNDDFMRFLASWALVHETADEGWKSAVKRGLELEPGVRRSKLGHNIQSYRDPAMARAALDFAVGITRVLPERGARGNPGAAPRIAVDVAMTNRAGHSIPDG